MSSHTIVRIKPAKPPSGSRIALHVNDMTRDFFTSLNLFFRPSSSGSAHLQSFADSLQDVLDRLPMIAGSVYDVEDAQGMKSKELVDDGRGADLIWVDSPTAYADLSEPPHVSPRDYLGRTEYSKDRSLLMAKFTNFSCGTLVMGISLFHMLVDFTSYVDLIKEWARVSRGDSDSDPLAITSWNRNPGIFFPPPTTGAISEDRRLPSGVEVPSPPSAVIMSDFLFTWESLRELKNLCTPTDPSLWVSTGDCLAAVAWRAITVAREGLLEPGADVQLHMTADGRSRSKVQPDASKYFGNLQTPYIATLSQSALLQGSVASVALACRGALNEQLTETSCANMLASDTEAGLIHEADSWLSNWTKYPLVGDALDFGRGGPFWASTIPMTAGVVMVVPQKDGYLACFTIEAGWESKLHNIGELLAYAKPVTTPH